MNNNPARTLPISLLVPLLLLLLLPGLAAGHCDTLDGPVVKAARNALATGDLTPLLKWVQAGDEPEIREAFQRTLLVRSKGPEAMELADRYFFETLVRIHRAGEGAPYTGLRPGTAVDPAVALADQALENGTIDHLATVLANAMTQRLRDHFHHTLEARKHADASVAAGRQFVEAYVHFTHYVEGLHGMIGNGQAHHAPDKPH